MASLFCGWTFSACTTPTAEPESEVLADNVEHVCDAESSNYAGFLILNEGMWGSNNCSLDFFDFRKGNYTHDLFGHANPSMAEGMGDVGNDLVVYDSRIYAVINASNLVEVMDLQGRHIGAVQVTNPRFMVCKDGFGYVSTYVNYVYKLDLNSLRITDSCRVGNQPEGLAMVGNELFAANSGGYLYPNYDSTISVVDLTSFKTTKEIKVAPNLFQLVADSHDQLWVVSHGNYGDIPSRLCCVNSKTHEVTDTLDIRVDDVWLDGDNLYAIAAGSFKVVDVTTRKVVKENFITDGTDTDIQTPYGLLVHPDTKRIYLSDVRNYASAGRLYCYSPEGKRLWTVFTDDVPGHLTLVK